jgi:hypothetical protein
MRTYQDIEAMAQQDYSIGLEAHYKPLANLINERGYKEGIEIGTAYGGNAVHLLINTEIELLICVDPYKYYPAMPGFTCQEEYDLLHQFANKRLSPFIPWLLFRQTSKEFYSSFFGDGEYEPSFDFVFLDGSHEYEDVKWECENYSTKIKPGGILCGHDFDIFEGVNKAVLGFAIEHEKKVNYLPGNIWYINY